MKTKIIEQGNGFPDVGDYVPGNDGNLYRVIKFTGQIQTGRSPGASNWVLAEVEDADWDDCPEEAEGPGMVIVDGDGHDEGEGESD